MTKYPIQFTTFKLIALTVHVDACHLAIY